MNTVIRKVDINDIDAAVMSEAAEIIRSGGLVAFPTETVYGLGANGLNADASAKIYAAKGRPSDNPLILHIYDISQLDHIVSSISPTAQKLINAFWPGPLTLIFPKSGAVPKSVTGGLDTVAVRMPVHPIAMSFLEAAKVPVAAPSANLSGRPSPTMASHVVEDFDGKIQMIIDGGRVDIGLESTIIDITGEIPVVLRPGYITEDMISSVTGLVKRDKSLNVTGADVTNDNYRPLAPGMKYRHYAPKADFTIYRGNIDNVISLITTISIKYALSGHRVGILTTDENIGRYKEKITNPGIEIVSLGRRSELSTVASNIYKTLRDFDAANTEYILGEMFEYGGLGYAIMNRLIKAAGYKIVEADNEV